MEQTQEQLLKLSTALLTGTVRKVTPTNMTGAVNGMVWKSPPDMIHVDAFRKKIPHWEYPFVLKSTGTNLLAPYNNGIYTDHKQFPTKCTHCGESFDHVELLEVGVQWQNVSSKLHVQTSQEEANRIFYAMRNRRVWYTIPLCHIHHLSDNITVFAKGQAVQGQGNNRNPMITLSFSNVEYGREFGELNHLTGRWVQPSIVGEVNFNNPEEVEQLKKPWWLKPFLIRGPMYLLSGVLFMLMLFSCLGGDGNIDFTEAEDWLGLLEFIGIVAFAVIAGFVGHYPAGNKPKNEKKSS